ncbi:hypothetical protein [Haloplanus salilacus]|uniref:hypothetical protein n=1 Tax=Haloplanus salilacus TaxID=2949994 RepID=UPI0030D15BB2
MSESEAKMTSEMSAEEELQMRVSGKEPSIQTISPDELREIRPSPNMDEKIERDVMGSHTAHVICGSTIFIASETGDVTPEMAASLLSHEMMHHILLAEIGVKAAQKYDAVADDHYEGFEDKMQKMKEVE